MARLMAVVVLVLVPKLMHRGELLTNVFNNFLELQVVSKEIYCWGFCLYICLYANIIEMLCIFSKCVLYCLCLVSLACFSCLLSVLYCVVLTQHCNLIPYPYLCQWQCSVFFFFIYDCGCCCCTFCG